MYLGNNLQVAFPSYTNIDDISGSFNGSTTSFALTVNGAAPVPFPLSSNQCLISVNGVVQRPDDSGIEGFRLSGGNIIFSSAPGGGEDFFGIILAGADYLNVGVNYPAGSAAVPSITFDGDLDTGLYNPGANQLGVSCGTTVATIFTSTGYSFLAGTSSAPGFYPTGDTDTGLYSPGANQLGISTAGSSRLTVDSSGNITIDTNTVYIDAANNRVGVGTASPAANTKLDLSGTYAANIVAVGALDIDCSAGNYFTKTINGNSAFTFSNVPSSRAFSFTLELTHTSGTVTWPAAVKWPADTAPTLTTGKTHLFIFVTDDGGTRWFASSLINYTT